jgi:aspartate/methionine/tyrosine aminotransferase
MPVTQTLAITPAQRLDNLRYAIRDLVGLANEVKKQGHKILFLNVGDPNIFDFATPAHVIEAAYRAMRDNKNGYAPSDGVPEALEAIRAEAAQAGMTSVQDVFITNGCGVVDGA